MTPPIACVGTKYTQYGTGLRHCMGIDPQWQVHQRCKCSKPEFCGEEEKTALRLAKEGHIKSNYILA